MIVSREARDRQSTCSRPYLENLRYMDINEFNESLEGLIKQAESLNAGESSLAWDYKAKIVVKRKKKKAN